MNGIKYLEDIQCCVKQCESTPLKNPDKTFFPFPDSDLSIVKVENADGNETKFDLRSVWINLCNIKPNEAVDAVICSKHFRHQDFQSVLTNGCIIPKLRSEAIPSISLNQPVESKKKIGEPVIHTNIGEPVIQDNVNSTTFSCHECNSNFKSNAELSLRMAIHDNCLRRYVCNNCNYKTLTIGAIRKHMKRSHSLKYNTGYKKQAPKTKNQLPKYDYWSYWSLNVDEFNTHLKQQEKIPEPEIPQLKSKPAKRRCNFCDYWAFNLKDIKEHIIFNHMMRPSEVIDPPKKIFDYMCIMCDFGCGELVEYKIHLSEHKSKE